MMMLEQYLAEAKLTQKAFAKKVGLSQPHISRLLNGKSWPQKDTLARIVLHTEGKVTAEDFLASTVTSGAAKDN